MKIARYRFPGLLGEDGPVIESVAPDTLNAATMARLGPRNGVHDRPASPGGAGRGRKRLPQPPVPGLAGAGRRGLNARRPAVLAQGVAGHHAWPRQCAVMSPL
jgi:hypothetical protein